MVKHAKVWDGGLGPRAEVIAHALIERSSVTRAGTAVFAHTTSWPKQSANWTVLPKRVGPDVIVVLPDKEKGKLTVRSLLPVELGFCKGWPLILNTATLSARNDMSVYSRLNPDDLLRLPAGTKFHGTPEDAIHVTEKSVGLLHETAFASVTCCGFELTSKRECLKVLKEGQSATEEPFPGYKFFLLLNVCKNQCREIDASQDFPWSFLDEGVKQTLEVNLDPPRIDTYAAAFSNSKVPALIRFYGRQSCVLLEMNCPMLLGYAMTIMTDPDLSLLTVRKRRLQDDLATAKRACAVLEQRLAEL
ncbi:unnamed protein product [Symbiodinium necroappetens]|uniref:Uncharacterized protein n=1 Tax=Symbiodinium necroappetens TaxID=1628268 RepID=A0A812SNK3_9DINO|nr:unnamed protein product [Symbiodinium necroappetens]